MRRALDAAVVDTYLDRLGLEREPPSADALRRLHERHVERVPYETLWIHEGEHWPIDPVTSAGRTATTARGGYCFHLNGGLAALLASLGYAVTLHVGGVHGPDGPSTEELTNHLVLLVGGLPTDSCPDGTWYVDVGLGDALHRPLPLAAGPSTQGPMTVTLEAVVPSAAAVGDWHLAHDPLGDFTGMSFGAAPVGIDAFTARHVRLSSSPDSPFVKVLSAQRRDLDRLDSVRGLVHSRTTAAGVAHVDLDRRADWLGVMGDVFGLAPEGDVDRLWDRLARGHERWVQAGRP